MPTDLPPDYKPQPAADPKGPGSSPGMPPSTGDDSLDPVSHKPGPNTGVGGPNGADDGDVVDPASPGGIPAPAGMPSF